MKKISWFWIAICTLLIIIVFVSWQQVGKLTPTAEILTQQEAATIIQERYQGNVSLIKLANSEYHIELEKQDQLYVIKLDAESGKVLSFAQANSTSTTPTPSPTPSQPPKVELSEEETIQPPKRLTENEAVQIATLKVLGEVDDIWLETEHNQTYYFVKIETKDDREATVVIHAITGEVTSVTWDDHESKKNENDKDDDD